MKRSVKLALIVALLIAVTAAFFGVFRMHQARLAEQAGRDSGVSAEELSDGSAGEGADGDKSSASEADGAAGDELLATVFFASDYQEEAGFDAPADTLRGVLEAAEADGKDIDKAVICGDYTNDPVLHDYQLSPDGSIDEIRSIVSEECTGLDSDDVLFVQGNHDAMSDQIAQTGLIDCGDYLIYILNTEEDFPWKQGKMAGCLAKVRKSSAAMKECFDGLIEKGEKRPVFIAGHVPLQFTARTSSRHTTGDNLYSSLIFDVVNEAAKSLDIVYLFGHNHSKGWDCYLGGSSVYLPEGAEILIPEFEESDINTDDYTKETLNFTYLNAGYVGYYMNCAPGEYAPGMYEAADETLTGTVFEVYGDRIEVTRYDSDGVHVLGHAGEGNPYKGGIDAGLISEEDYSAETESPQVITN